MILLRTKTELRNYVRQVRQTEQSLGLVPTMGALHPGHGSLIRASADKHPATVVTIFVNPLQFGANEDLDQYPRRLQADMDMAASFGATAVFAPSPDEIYPQPTQTLIRHDALDALYCGAFRPGHFQGVLTVVAKLLNLAQADAAYFGSKDYQQLHLIRQMALDLDIPTQIVGLPTVREQDGLALSSRNEYLSAQERQNALGIYQGLLRAREAYESGQRDPATLADLVRSQLGLADSIQYVHVLDAATLLPTPALSGPGVILVAAYYGKTRLIDNIVLN